MRLYLGMSCALHCPWEREVKSGAPVHLTLSPGCSLVTVNNPLDICQPDASAFVLLRGMQSLEHAEELARVLHVEPDTIVSNEHHQVACLVEKASNFDLGLLPFASKLHGIGKQVDHHQAHHCAVHPDFRKESYFPFDFSFLSFLTQLLQGFLEKLLKADEPQLQFRSPNPRESQ